MGATATPVVREFATGANRDRAEGKLDYLGFCSPKAQRRFGAYMNKNRRLADGSIRDSDNWQKGIPIPVYAESLMRHAQEVHELIRDAVRATKIGAHRLLTDAPVDHPAMLAIDEAVTALFFNAQGWLDARVVAMDDLGVPYPGKRVHGKPPLSYPESERLMADWVAQRAKKPRGARRH